MAIQMEKWIVSGMFFMLFIVGFSTFIGGTINEYEGSTVNTSFNTTYNRMSELYDQSDLIQDNMINNVTVEGEKGIIANALDAFGILKTAFLKIPKILFNSWQIMFSKPAAGTNLGGGVIYTLAYTLGIPNEFLFILISVAAVLLSLSILKLVLGARI